MNDIISWFMSLLALIAPGVGDTEAPLWNGYVEADYFYAAAPSGGTIATMEATEGEMVEAGEVLFILDASQQEAAMRAAEAQVRAAEANVDNLSTGSRDAELDVIRADLTKARADLELARSQAQRTQELLDRGLVPQAQADRDHAALASAEAGVAQLEAQLRVAELPARDPQREAAQANLIVARAQAEQARQALADRTILAPDDARVVRVFYAPGEIIPAGGPVISLLPEQALKVKFYVPQADRADLALGQTVAISCDNCAPGLEAAISYFAPEPQFTPPVIYSREERDRLTFLVEATLEGDALHPGQPVTVEP